MGGDYKELPFRQALAVKGRSQEAPATEDSRSSGKASALSWGNTRHRRGGGGTFGGRRQIPAGANQQRGGYPAESHPDKPGQRGHNQATQDDSDALDSFLESHHNFGVDSTEDFAEDRLPVILPHVRGRVVKLAMNPKGCRLLQRVLELVTEKEMVALVTELKGHVCAAVESPHANHVLQKAIVLLPPFKVRFIADELLVWDRQPSLARHQYGCRVLERLIEHFPGEWLEEFTAGILQDGKALARSNYGNFVLQHLLEHGLPHVRERIVQLLLEPVQEFRDLALNQSACGVLDSALNYAAPHDQRRLAQQLLNTPGLLTDMCSSKHRGGNEVVKRLFRIHEDGICAQARVGLEKGAPELMQQKQGKAFLEACMPDKYQFSKDSKGENTLPLKE